MNKIMKQTIFKWMKIGGLTLGLTLVLTGCSLAGFKLSKNKTLKPEEAKAKAESYINDNLMEGRKATVDAIAEENGIYKLTVNLGGGQKVDSYMTKDGSTFFPQGLNINETLNNNNQNQANSNTPPTPAEVKKADKPTVELFVMSYCPYGLQIEKGIIPVVQKLGDKINFKLKFCDYAMHGEKELQENMNQYCIDKNEPKKFLSYLQCFTKSGDSAACVKSSGVDSGKLASCVSSTDKQFNVMKKFNDQTGYKGSYPPFDVYAADNQKYSVGGSPTLIINGSDSQSGRSPADLMASICAGFNKMPDVCKEKMDAASPSAGFGEGTDSASGNTAGCGQ